MPLHPMADADEHSIFGSFTPAEFYARHSVTHSSDFIFNAHGVKLFTQWWTPLPTVPTIGMVALVHGFTADSSSFIQLTAIFFAKLGYIACAIDHQAHGYSDGLNSHIPNINPLVDDCITFFHTFRENHARNLPAFLYAESLGGAIALYVTLRQKGVWDGLILNGAMCGISTKIKPPWPLEYLLTLVATLVPTWQVIPTRVSVVDSSFKTPWKRILAVRSRSRPLLRPRAATAYELVRVCNDLQKRFEEIDVPLLIVHGGDDVVCDPVCVVELHRRAASRDKSIIIYPKMWHQLVGESEEDVELVFGNMLDWLKIRSKQPLEENENKACAAISSGA